MKRVLLATVAACALLSASHAKAQVGLCVTVNGPCSSEPNQLIAYAEQLLQADTEAKTLIQEVTNTLSLGDTTFNDLTAEVNAITAIAADANMLLGHSGEMLTRLTTYFDPSTLNWHQVITDNANAVGKAMTDASMIINHLQTLGTDTARLATLVDQIMNVVGRNQSLQTLQATLSQTGQSLQRTQMTTVANQQAMMTYFAAQQDWQQITHHVSDRDLEVEWVNNCAAIARLGGPMPPGCAGAQ